MAPLRAKDASAPSALLHDPRPDRREELAVDARGVEYVRGPDAGDVLRRWRAPRAITTRADGDGARAPPEGLRAPGGFDGAARRARESTPRDNLDRARVPGKARYLIPSRRSR